MARGIFQSDHTSAPHAVAAEIAKRREHDAKDAHRWREYNLPIGNGTTCRQRECTVKACAAIETWNERAGEWL